MLDEDAGGRVAADGKTAHIGGMVSYEKIKSTKNEKVMAFLQVEDLVGSVEVIVFPGQYERYGSQITEDSKVFIKGRISVEEEKDGKLICEQITPFDQVPRKLWIKFPTKEDYERHKEELLDALRQSEGRDSVVIYVENPKAMNPLPRNWNVHAGTELVGRLGELYGSENIKVV